jgi:hypothetical protein
MGYGSAPRSDTGIATPKEPVSFGTDLLSVLSHPITAKFSHLSGGVPRRMDRREMAGRRFEFSHSLL